MGDPNYLPLLHPLTTSPCRCDADANCSCVTYLPLLHPLTTSPYYIPVLGLGVAACTLTLPFMPLQLRPKPVAGLPAHGGAAGALLRIGVCG